ncbi:RNA-binding protein rnp24 OS=Schizosaccharomyces pombe (strain 972 / ATCC 24843) GN=rnp24 PE=4 SV=2 [Rhizoctonia solani AG-1 IB]|uniref:RNA-binding protein rnp24 n=1 Tax=Thanatephorus cucumeris (strain AG1-IB / isolate 7/3/14) TaxID=1108050 RepID=A0A0B7FTG2_THACB|nr:RNA-binding protein rnp24 OS=Schizosaccharomyces pombe (strain 972 / ATCC 24843) GN=rnp24 PE=4 SV=2 [Rhizoctonia solani AG-1 IB]
MVKPTSPLPTKQKKSKDSKETDELTLSDNLSSGSNNIISDESNDENETHDEPEPEVEVLSHAAQRKAKKQKLKEAQSAANGEDSEASSKRPAKLQTKPNDKPDPPVRQNSVWVGNLSFKTTEAQLKSFFSDAGEVSRIHMPKKLDVGQGRGMRGENRGFAYVDFTTPEAQTIAITLSEKNLDGRRLLIKKGDDFAGRPSAPKAEVTSGEGEEAKVSANKVTANTHSKTAQKILAAQKQPAAQTLFMGNLPFETKEDDIRQMVEGHGLPSELEQQAKQDGAAKNPGGKPQRWLKKIRMGTFEDSGLCKGWAFLDFLNTTYATAVLVNSRNHHLNGRKLVLEYGSPDAVRRGGGGPRPNKRHVENEEAKETPRAAKKRKFAEGNAENADESEDVAKSPQKSKPKGDEQYIRAKDGRLRPKPGAALAMAKKETVAIVPSTGKRTVF